MIKYNDNNIFVGYIKNLLHTFNLPFMRVYKEDLFLYPNEIILKDDYVQTYDNSDGQLKILFPYTYNKPFLNYTTTLRLNSLIYDSHTHNYLGNYLRFIRDYHNLDLMSMYNCFSNELIDYLNIKWKINDQDTLSFETNNEKYKVYACPVKLGKKYTIAVSSITGIEVICGIYSNGLLSIPEKIETGELESITNKLSRLTYKKINYCDFKKPFIYDNLCLNTSGTGWNDKNLQEEFFYKNEKDLKLFIKIPNNVNSSIVILEGEYLNTNQKTLDRNLNGIWNQASTIVNYKKDYFLETPNPVLIDLNSVPVKYAYYSDDSVIVDEKNIVQTSEVGEYKTEINDKLKDIKLLTSLQLLELNTGESYPFADRLIEYLCGNVITHLENIPDNIERVQEALIRRSEESKKQKVGIQYYLYSGIWEEKYKNIFYDIAREEKILDNKFDVLGYVDKDIESKLGSDVDIYEKE